MYSPNIFGLPSQLILLLSCSVSACAHGHHDLPQTSNQEVTINEKSMHHDDPDPLPQSTRVFWMREAVKALKGVTGSPCPFGAFGTAIVNHTESGPNGIGRLICIGANAIESTGNPTLHGEIAAINNCTSVLSSPPYDLPPHSISLAFKDLSLYTTAEACPMCASAIRWSGFKEYIYATPIDTLVQLGWSRIGIDSATVFQNSYGLETRTSFIGSVLANETDQLFGWQFQNGSCPIECRKKLSKCVANEAPGVL